MRRGAEPAQKLCAHHHGERFHACNIELLNVEVDSSVLMKVVKRPYNMSACDLGPKPAGKADCLIKKTNKEPRGRDLGLGLCIQTGYSALD